MVTRIGLPRQRKLQFAIRKLKLAVQNMKRCPHCHRTELDDALAFCRADGTALVDDFPNPDAGTMKFGSASHLGETQTRVLPSAVTDPSIVNPTTVLDARQTPHSTGELSRPNRNRQVAFVVFGVCVMALMLGGYFYLTRNRPTAIESIAVLPFENKSNDADTEYLSDGLAESLIYSLSQLPNLKVSPTSSVMRYKGKATDVKTIANELGVGAVLTGRIAQRGDNLTISVELVDVRNNKVLWGQQYDRKVADLLATQREIATEIAQNLKLKLSGEGERKLTKKYTDNNEAYQLYLKGRFHYAKRTKDDIRRGIEYFQQAIKLDPNFALAYVGIADSYITMPSFTYLSPREAFPQANEAAQRALGIDPTLPEAHAALATSLAVYNWNWVESERGFKRALELDPNLSGTHFRYGIIYMTPVGRTDEAITELKRAVELEPLSLITSANLAATYMYARQNGQALEQAKKTYDLEPSFVAGRFWLASIYDANGMYAEAIALSEKSLQSDPTNQLFLSVAGYAYAKSGRRREAEDVLKKFKEIAKTQYVMSYLVATIYAALGQRDEAFTELERAFAERDWYLKHLKVDPFLDPLRDDPRFADLVKRIGLPQ